MTDKIYKFINKNKYIMLIITFALIFLVQMYYGVQKKGYYVDEFYSFFSTNRTAGLYQPDREWQDNETIRNEFVVLDGEGFNYGLVKLVQSWDVHPPFYYYVLHTVCSIWKNVFSKWLGIGTNLIALLLSLIFLYLLCGELKIKEHHKLMLLLIWGLNPMTVSSVMFIRMYAWLTAAVLGCAWAHVRLLQALQDGRLYADSDSVKGRIYSYIRYIFPIMFISYIGFLTQYYYLIFFVFIGFCVVFYNMFLRNITASELRFERSGIGHNKGYAKGDENYVSFKKRLTESLIYVTSCAFSLVLAVLSYTACLSQIFHGYRGKEAMEAFSDSENIITRISFFAGLINDYLFSGMFRYLLLLIIIFIIVIQVMRKRLDNRSGSIGNVSLSVKLTDTVENVDSIRVSLLVLVVTTVLYFLTVSKTALLLGDTSNRYEMPVYPIILMLMFMAFYFILNGCMMISVRNNYKQIRIFAFVITSIMFITIDIKGLIVDKNVLFLYPEAQERLEFAAEKAADGDVAVIMYNEATPDNVWRLTDQILQYDKAYYVSEGNTDAISDIEVTSAESLVVYAASSDNQQEMLDMLQEVNPNIDSCTLMYTVDEIWTVYYLE
jgi:hypothetical protein